jgi:hypothetical protein
MNVIEEARKRLKLSVDADGENRALAIEDLKFASGEQWPDEIRMQRQLDKRPCLTINKTDTFIRAVVNNMRQQRPRIKVHPVSDGADEKVADVIQGLIRHIEINSNADLAYDTAADYQVRMGWGYILVRSDYISPDSFDQELYIDRIRNPFSVYFDPSSISPDGSDAEWCIITERMKREAFKQQYPQADPVDFKAMGEGDDIPLWATKEEITVAQYYRVVETPDMLCMTTDGRKYWKSQFQAYQEYKNAGLIAAERESMRRAIKWSKITAKEELESIDLKGKYIPVVPVYGAELVIDGKVQRFGMTRQLKDPQKMYNFWRTSETEVVALAPKAPWLMAEGQDEGMEDEWETANNRSFSRLKYKPIVDDQGNALPPPIRQQPQQIPAAQVNAAMAASEDLKAVAGMFDPALGAEGNETSGRMVDSRQRQSDLSNFHFYDNLTRSIRHIGKILLDLIPYYYDTQRVVRIIGEDGEPESVTLNQRQLDEMGAVQKVLNDVRVGLYDVVMDTGPGYQTRRQEAAAGMLEMLKTELGKQIGAVAGDLVVKQFDIPGIEAVADRLAAANPMAQMEKQLPKDLPDEAKHVIMALMAQLKQAQQQAQQLAMEKQAHVFGEQVKQQGKLASDQLWGHVELQKTQIQQDGENRRTLAKEHAANERNTDDNRTWLTVDSMKVREDRFEAILDAHTDIKLAKDRPPHNEPA